MASREQWRERLPRRPCAVPRMSWSVFGSFAPLSCQGRRPCTGEGEAQAPSTRVRRAWGVPAVGMAPYWRRSPRAYAAGSRPSYCLPGRGGSQRVRSPSAATMVTATGPCPPVAAWWAPIAREPGATRASCRDTDEACGLRWERAGELIDSRVSGADGPVGDTVGVVILSDIGHGAGVFVDIQTNLECARL